jgi:hypothetical protein
MALDVLLPVASPTQGDEIADDLRLCPSPVTAAAVSATLPFVIPSEAEGSAVLPVGNQCCPSLRSQNLSSVKLWDRSAVEGPAVIHPLG